MDKGILFRVLAIVITLAAAIYQRTTGPTYPKGVSIESKITGKITMFINRKKQKFGWILVAAIVMVIIFSIPHSMLGSELDYTSGQVIQN